MAAFVLLGILSAIPANAGQVEPWNGQTGMRETFTVLFDGSIYTNSRWVESSHCPADAGPYAWDNSWEYLREATADELKNIANPTTCDAATDQGNDNFQDETYDFDIDQNDAAENTDLTNISDPTIQQGIDDIFKTNVFELGMFWEIYDTYMESNTVQVKGIDGSAAISVKGSRGTLGLWEDNKEEDDTGEYRINYGPWTKTPGTVNKNDWVQVRHKPSVQAPGSFTSTTLVIGDKEGVFRTDGNWESADKRTTDVDPITIPEKSGEPGKWVESEPFELQGEFPQEIPFVHVAMMSSAGEYRTLVRDGDKYTVHSKWTSKKATDVIARLYIQLRVKTPSRLGSKTTAKIKCSNAIGNFTVTVPSILRTQLAGNSLEKRPHFEYVKAFNVNAPVQVFISPKRFPWIVDKTANIYIVEALNDLKENQNLDLRAASKGSRMNFTFGDTIKSNIIEIAGPNTLEASVFDPDTKANTGLGHPYDIVIDMNQNNILDEGDLVDGASREAGLYVIGDTTQNGPLKVKTLNISLDDKTAEKFGIPVTEIPDGFDPVKDKEIIESFYPTLTKELLYYPEKIKEMKPRPLIVISHGAGHKYTWYNHLGEFLASYGYIVMTHQNDAFAARKFTLVINHTDALLDIADTVADGALAGKIDSNRIVWIGHSFGAMSAPKAYHKLVTKEAVPTHYTKDSIVLVSSMLPPPGTIKAGYLPGDVNYHVWVASGDSEVKSNVADMKGWSSRLYERATGWRMMTTVQGTGHGWFHNGGPDSAAAFVGPYSIGMETTHQIQKGLFLPLIKHFTEGNIPATDFFYRQYERFHPIGVDVEHNSHIVVTNECRENPKEVFMIDDYEKNPSQLMSSSGGKVEFDVSHLKEGLLGDKDGTFGWVSEKADPFNGATQTCLPCAKKEGVADKADCDDVNGSHGVVFDWDGKAQYYQWEVIPEKRDLTAYKYISFRGAQVTRHPNTLAVGGDVTFSLTLIDGAKNSSSINIGAYGGGLEQPYHRIKEDVEKERSKEDKKKSGKEGKKEDDNIEFENGGWLNEMERIRIRLEDFLVDGNSINLSNIIAVRLDVGPESGSEKGRIIIDELMLSK